MKIDVDLVKKDLSINQQSALKDTFYNKVYGLHRQRDIYFLDDFTSWQTRRALKKKGLIEETQDGYYWYLTAVGEVVIAALIKADEDVDNLKIILKNSKSRTLIDLMIS